MQMLRKKDPKLDATFKPHEETHYHGTRHELTELRPGSYVTPHVDDAAIFAVPWDSKELVDKGTDPDGRPPKKLHFKDKVPRDHAVYIYKVTGGTEKALTNTGRDYTWNRTMVGPSKIELHKKIDSWHKELLADAEKTAAHADDRLKERTDLDPEVLYKLRKQLKKTDLPRGHHHVRLSADVFAVLKDTGKTHVVATILKHPMKPRGSDVRHLLKKEASLVTAEEVLKLVAMLGADVSRPTVSGMKEAVTQVSNHLLHKAPEISHLLHKISAAALTKTYNVCPTCSEEGESRCRCKVGHRKCANGHEWVHCGEHDKNIITTGIDTHKVEDRGTCKCHYGHREHAEHEKTAYPHLRK